LLLLIIAVLAIKYLMVWGEVLPKVTFMPIDSFNVNIIGRVIGTVQGTLTPCFRLIIKVRGGRYPSGMCSGDPYPQGSPRDHYP
jgi:hypothetical protein